MPVPKFTVRNYFFRRKIVQYVMGILHYFLEQFISTAAFRMQIDLSDYEKSGTWDVFDVPGEINTTIDKKTGQYNSRANYTVYLRRKTLFYTVNLIVPSVLISILSMVSFYLPTTAGEKITMTVSVLLALIVFLQVVLFVQNFRFYPRDAMRKRGLCCRRASVWMSVCHTPVFCLNT